jgi:hypothetical protein
MLKHSHNQRIIVGSGCCNLLQFLPIFVPNLINIQFLFTNHSHKCIFLFMHACCCFTLETNSLNFCRKKTKQKQNKFWWNMKNKPQRHSNIKFKYKCQGDYASKFFGLSFSFLFSIWWLISFFQSRLHLVRGSSGGEGQFYF